MSEPSKPSLILGERELDIMQALWRLGAPATVAEVHRDLEAHGHRVAYTTVQTMLNRLEAKGKVSRDAVDRAHRYQAAIAEQSMAGDAVGRVLDRFFGGSPAALASHLVASGLDKGELDRVRKLIDSVREEDPT